MFAAVVLWQTNHQHRPECQRIYSFASMRLIHTAIIGDPYSVSSTFKAEVIEHIVMGEENSLGPPMRGSMRSLRRTNHWWGNNGLHPALKLAGLEKHQSRAPSEHNRRRSSGVLDI